LRTQARGGVKKGGFWGKVGRYRGWGQPKMGGALMGVLEWVLGWLYSVGEESKRLPG
jgi:hypothetical protein